MSTLWLIDKPESEEEPITKIVFDISDRGDYSYISTEDSNLIMIVDENVDDITVNTARLYEALTKAITLGWFKPNQSTLSSMANILRKDGFHVS